MAALREWLELSDEEAATKKALKAAEAELDDQAYGRYDSLADAEVRELVVSGKWLATLEQSVASEGGAGEPAAHRPGSRSWASDTARRYR